MSRNAFLAVFMLLASAVGRGEVVSIHPGPECKPAGEGQRLSVAHKPKVTIEDVLRWASNITCQRFSAEGALLSRTITVTTWEPMRVEQARDLLRAGLLAAGLKVRLSREGLEVVPDTTKPRMAAVTIPSDAPSVEIGHRLVATVVGEMPERGKAVFRDKKGRQRVVGVGERIGNATLLAVGQEQVLVRTGTGKKAREGVVALVPGAGQGDVATTIGGVDLRGAVKTLGEQKWEIGRRAVAMALKDPRGTLRLVRLAPEREGNVVRGWRVSGFAPDSLPARIGLRSGDVLLKVNGRSLVDPEELMALYLDLKVADRVVVTLERRKKLLELEYLIR